MTGSKDHTGSVSRTQRRLRKPQKLERKNFRPILASPLRGSRSNSEVIFCQGGMQDELFLVFPPVLRTLMMSPQLALCCVRVYGTPISPHSCCLSLSHGRRVGRRLLLGECPALRTPEWTHHSADCGAKLQHLLAAKGLVCSKESWKSGFHMKPLEFYTLVLRPNNVKHSRNDVTMLFFLIVCIISMPD